MEDRRKLETEIRETTKEYQTDPERANKQSKRKKSGIRMMNVVNAIILALAFLLREDIGKVYDYVFANWEGVLEVAFVVGLIFFIGFIQNLGEPNYKNVRSGPVFISHMDKGGGWGWGTFFG